MSDKSTKKISLNSLFNELIQSIPKQVLEKFVLERLQKEYELNDLKLSAEIADYFLAGGLSPYTLPAQQNTELGVFSFSDSDATEVSSKCEHLGKEIPNLLEKVVNATAKSSNKDFVNDWKHLGAVQLIEREAFEALLYLRWKMPLDLLQMQIHISREIGEDFLRRTRRSKSKKRIYRNECLGRLHVRAVRVFSEATRLLETGYPDAALARWRTIHEISVIVSLLGSNDDSLAQRYYEHQVIDELRGAQSEIKSRGILKLSVSDQKYLRELDEKQKSLVLKFGKSFKDDYGWAEPILKGKSCNFRELEELANLGGWRSQYRLANGQIHPSSNGLTHTYATPYFDYTFSSAASNFGLMIPGQSLSRSMLQINCHLIDSRQAVDRLLELRKLLSIDQLCSAAFSKVHTSLLKEEGLL